MADNCEYLGFQPRKEYRLLPKCFQLHGLGVIGYFSHRAGLGRKVKKTARRPITGSVSYYILYDACKGKKLSRPRYTPLGTSTIPIQGTGHQERIGLPLLLNCKDYLQSLIGLFCCYDDLTTMGRLLAQQLEIDLLHKGRGLTVSCKCGKGRTANENSLLICLISLLDDLNIPLRVALDDQRK